MAVHDQISATRDCGRVTCGPSAATDLEGVARAFGLSTAPGTYREIDRAAAEHVIQRHHSISSRSLARGCVPSAAADCNEWMHDANSEHEERSMHPWIRDSADSRSESDKP
jgi:hypothetical protein